MKGGIVKELTQDEFENEVANGCDDRTDRGYIFGGCRAKCGTGFCRGENGSRLTGCECHSILKVRKWLKDSGVVGVVMFRNKDMWASRCGASSCVVVGPSYTYKNIEECRGKWINDLPSQRQYAEFFVRRV